MSKDHIVDEVRRVREEQAAKYDFDVKAILDAARKRQRRSSRKVVSLLPKKIANPPKEAIGTLRRSDAS